MTSTLYYYTEFMRSPLVRLGCQQSPYGNLLQKFSKKNAR